MRQAGNEGWARLVQPEHRPLLLLTAGCGFLVGWSRILVLRLARPHQRQVGAELLLRLMAIVVLVLVALVGRPAERRLRLRLGLCWAHLRVEIRRRGTSVLLSAASRWTQLEEVALDSSLEHLALQRKYLCVQGG